MNPRQTILLVDDSEDDLFLMRVAFKKAAFNSPLQEVHNGEQAIAYLKGESIYSDRNQYPLPSVVLLDLNMPMKNGFALAKEMTAFKPETPFLFLTAQGDKEDRIRGFEHGAEDYIIKPFSMQELALRIQVILRRSMQRENESKTASPVTFRNYTFYPDRRELTLGEETIQLSEIESRLLGLFLQSPDRVVLREDALKQLWKEEHLFRDKSLNVFVSRLRQLLKADPSIEIQNIHGSGYRMIIR